MSWRKVIFYFRQFDWILFWAIFLLVFFGLAAIYSITLSKEVPDFLNFRKQVFSFLIGLVLFFTFSLIDYKIYKHYYLVLYGLAVALLGAVLLLGQTIRGTRGWFVLGTFNFEPVELVKIFLVIFLAKYFSDHARELNRLRYLLLGGAATALLVLFVLLEPDLGWALILFILWFGLVLIIGTKRSYLLLILGLIILVIISSWFLILKPYQKNRLSTFVNPLADPLGRGYNMTQAIIAVGSGEILGRGLGFGSQSQLRFLPESQTDFIFAVIAEELGLVGVIFVLSFFLILLYRIWQRTQEIQDDFGLFLALGILILLSSEIFVNIGMNIGLAPITGITLPLVSYGGSSLVTNLIMLGILESIFIRNRK